MVKIGSHLTSAHHPHDSFYYWPFYDTASGVTFQVQVIYIYMGLGPTVSGEEKAHGPTRTRT